MSFDVLDLGVQAPILGMSGKCAGAAHSPSSHAAQCTADVDIAARSFRHGTSTRMRRSDAEDHDGEPRLRAAIAFDVCHVHAYASRSPHPLLRKQRVDQPALLPRSHTPPMHRAVRLPTSSTNSGTMPKGSDSHWRRRKAYPSPFTHRTAAAKRCSRASMTLASLMPSSQT